MSQTNKKTKQNNNNDNYKTKNCFPFITMQCKVFEGISLVMLYFALTSWVRIGRMYSFSIQCIQLLMLSFLILKSSCLEGKFLLTILLSQFFFWFVCLLLWLFFKHDILLSSRAFFSDFISLFSIVTVIFNTFSSRRLKHSIFFFFIYPIWHEFFEEAKWYLLGSSTVTAADIKYLSCFYSQEKNIPFFVVPLKLAQT